MNTNHFLFEGGGSVKKVLKKKNFSKFKTQTLSKNDI